MKNKLSIEPIKPLHEDEFMTGSNTKVMFGEIEVHGVASVDITYRPNDVVRATVELFPVKHTLEGAEADVFMHHPITGELRQIKSIQYYDAEDFKA